MLSTRSYDLRGQVTEIDVTAPTGTVLDRSLTYDYTAGAPGPNDPGPNLDRVIDNRDSSQSGGLNLYAYVVNNPLSWIDPLGLSRVVFNRHTGDLLVFPGDSADVQGPPQRFPAANRVRSPSANPWLPEGNGPAPAGTFPTGRLVEVSDEPNSSFGTAFVPIILPPTGLGLRTGVGIHAGRANTDRGVEYQTLGCIRTTEDALDALRRDAPIEIEVLP